MNPMALIHSFPPAAARDAHTLILGSMPGDASLRAGEYYANPRNHFWKILGVLVGAGPELPYPARLEKLTGAGFALWDVLQSCERQGSLDSSIISSSITANDFATFLTAHPGIQRIFFNGTAAETAFRRFVIPALPALSCSLHRLPSTSPANARFTLQHHLDAWQILCPPPPVPQCSST